MFTKIEDAIEWISRKKHDHCDFASFKELCHSLKDPQDDLCVIHVAGTDGKGSTVTYLADLLKSQGLKVGTYTSPHYLTHLDRIRINGENIDADSFMDIINGYYDLFVEYDLSMFQMDFLIMCEYFRREKVDVAIIEVGIGGRLDSTNVVNNTKLSIITSIGFDHMELLGDTLTAICKEKCGIVKEGSSLLIGMLDEECTDIARKTAEEKHCRFYKLDGYTETSPRHFIFHGHEYAISSYAEYQLHNASLAICAFELFCAELQIIIDQEKADKALQGSLWRGRFEIVREDPRIILDGAHNIHGAEALAASIDRLDGSKCIIFSALKRKEYLKMVELLKEHCDRLIITSFDSYGVIDLKEFSAYECVEDYREAIERAMKEYDNIVICGSLYFLSDVVSNTDFS